MTKLDEYERELRRAAALISETWTKVGNDRSVALTGHGPDLTSAILFLRRAVHEYTEEAKRVLGELALEALEARER